MLRLVSVFLALPPPLSASLCLSLPLCLRRQLCRRWRVRLSFSLPLCQRAPLDQRSGVAEAATATRDVQWTYTPTCTRMSTANSVAYCCAPPIDASRTAGRSFSVSGLMHRRRLLAEPMARIDWRREPGSCRSCGVSVGACWLFREVFSHFRPRRLRRTELQTAIFTRIQATRTKITFRCFEEAPWPVTYLHDVLHGTVPPPTTQL